MGGDEGEGEQILPSALFERRLARTSEGKTKSGRNSSRCRSPPTRCTSGHTKCPITIITMAMAVSLAGDWLKNPEAPAVRREAEEDQGSVTIPSASKAASHSRPGSRSPAFASSMIFWATASRVGLTTLSACWRATRANSKAKPKRRNVSRVEPMALKMLPHRHGSYVNSTVRNLLEIIRTCLGFATNHRGPWCVVPR